MSVDFVDRIMAAWVAELDVCCDALLQAGWPPSRMLQARRQNDNGGVTTTIILRPGIEFPAELPVFEAGYVLERDDAGLHASVFAAWLVDPVPTPHQQTIRYALFEAAEAAR